MKLEFDHSNSGFHAVLDIARRLQSLGGRAFLVGGCVRDALLGTPGQDFDVEVYGLSSDAIVKGLEPDYSLSLVGMSFGVMKVHGYDIDLAVPRRENKTGAGHRGFMVTVEPGLSYREAAARRDFTVNAIMADPLTSELVDPFGGAADLASGVLRHTSEHFSEDPLRVLRCMQFVSRFEFAVAPETVELCRSLSQDELPAERLAGEWEKMLLKGKKPSLGLRFLADCGWIRFYPQLDALRGCEQSPKWHPEGDVWNHTLRCLDASVRYRTGDRDEDLCVTLGALCHDLGKPLTTQVESDGRITSKGHAEAGQELARTFVDAIWHRPDLAEQVGLLTRYHMEPYVLVRGNARDSAFRRLSLAVKRMDLLHKVCCCDNLGLGRPDVTLDEMDRFLERVNQLAIRDSVPKPLVLGRHLMDMGLKPGPAMGPVLRQCFEAQLDGEFTTLEQGLDLARKLVKEIL